MKKSKKYMFLILLVVGIFLCFNGPTYAKYVSKTFWDFYLNSKGFYFSSDYLDSTAVSNVNNLWNGESVHFNIKNNLNENVIANYDIGYTTVCTIIGDAESHAVCHLNGTNLSTQNGILPVKQVCVNKTEDNVDVSEFTEGDCKLGGYDWINQISTQDLYFDVVLTDYNYVITDVSVNITVTSTSPYRKVLSGNFILHKSDIEENTIAKSYNNYSNYDRLIISNSYSSSKCVKVTWDANKLIINADNSAFSSYLTDENGYINQIKFNIGAKSSSSYIFYKRDFDGIIVPDTDILIEETSGC